MALKRAAEHNQPCPTNEQLGELCGSLSPTFAVERLKSLVRRKLIVVERFANNRIVTIVATGQQTKGERGAPHWRDVKKHKPKPKKLAVRPRRVTESDARNLPVDQTQMVERDPCPRCGVRKDIGCIHYELNPHQRAITSQGV